MRFSLYLWQLIIEQAFPGWKSVMSTSGLHPGAQRLGTESLMDPFEWRSLLIHPFLSEPGFCAAILGVLRVKEEGFISGGPPCGSFVWINRATSGRSQALPYGDQSIEPFSTKYVLDECNIADVPDVTCER